MVHTLGYDVLRAYKQCLMEKPKKGKQLSYASVDKYLGVPKAFFNWAVRNNHIQNNPADGLQIGKKATGKRADELQDIFELDDLKKLFLSEHYLKTGFQYRKSVGIDAPPRHKTFHSFRHTFATSLALADVPTFEIGNIVGHANKSQTEGRYIKRFDPRAVMERAIMKLNFVDQIGLKKLIR